MISDPLEIPEILEIRCGLDPEVLRLANLKTQGRGHIGFQGFQGFQVYLKSLKSLKSLILEI